MAEQVSGADGRELREPLQEPLRLRALSDARRPDKNDSGGFAEAHPLAFGCLRGAYSGDRARAARRDQTRREKLAGACTNAVLAKSRTAVIWSSAAIRMRGTSRS